MASLLEPSPALFTIGMSRAEAREVIRFSLSRETRKAEIDRVLEIVPAAVAAARARGGMPVPAEAQAVR